MLKNLTEALRSEVACYWPEIAWYAQRRATLSETRGGFIFLPDPNGWDDFWPWFMERAFPASEAPVELPPEVASEVGASHARVRKAGPPIWYDYTARKGFTKEVSDLDGVEMNHGLAWFDGIPMPEDMSQEQYVEQLGLMEWQALQTDAEECGGVLVAMQHADGFVWNEFWDVDGVTMPDAARRYAPPSHPGTVLGDENLLMN
jgi:hypothetical protein